MIFSLVAMAGLEVLHNICISAVAMSLRWATCGPRASCLKNRWTKLSQISYEALLEWRNKSLFKWFRSHDQDGCQGKNPSKIFSKIQIAPYTLRSQLLKNKKSSFFDWIFSSHEPLAHWWAYSLSRLRCHCLSSVGCSLSTFSRTSPLKPLGRWKSNFMWRLIGMGEQKFRFHVGSSWDWLDIKI